MAAAPSACSVEAASVLVVVLLACADIPLGTPVVQILVEIVVSDAC